MAGKHGLAKAALEAPNGRGVVEREIKG